MDKGFAIALFVLILGATIISVSIYLEITNDSNKDCSIDKVLECMDEGGTIYFMPGTYNITNRDYTLICENCNED